MWYEMRMALRLWESSFPKRAMSVTYENSRQNLTEGRLTEYLTGPPQDSRSSETWVVGETVGAERNLRKHDDTM